MSNELAAYIDKTQDRFQIAPASMRFDAERGFALSLLSSNQYLREAAEVCPNSLVQAMASVAAIGLSLNPASREAYLITRNIKVGDNQWQARVCLEPSYMGLCKLATDSGGIKWVQANCVYSHDDFVDHGPGERPSHTYSAFSKDRGEFVGVYCVAKTKDGDYLNTIMDAEKVYSIRDRSEAYARRKMGPWVTDFEEMAKKSVIRQAFKTWPRSEGGRMAEAVHLSNENEAFEPLLTSPKITSYTAEQKQYFDQLIEQGDALGMFAFMKTLDNVSIITGLYNSFESGKKTQYKRIVGDLESKGRVIKDEYVTAIDQYAEMKDDAGLAELLSEVPDDVLKIIKQECSADALGYINELQDAA